MLKLKKERIKTFLLIFLISTSLIQIGIHWYQQAQGFPFNFFIELFKYSEPRSKDVGDLKAGYFMPEAVIVLSGTTQFKLEQDSSNFKKIWSDIKDNYLPAVIKAKPNKVITKDQWKSITSEPCIRIDFSADWPSEIVFWLEETSSRDFRGFNSIKSIAIQPQKDVNQTVNPIFIYDEEQVYQYNINIKGDFLSKDFYTDIVENYQSDRKLEVLTKYYPIFKTDKDILISLSNKSNISFSTIKIEIPSEIQLEKPNIDSVQVNLLHGQRERLAPKYSVKEGQAIFTDTENLFKYNVNGLLEYQYLPSKGGSAGKASSAFNHALSFIELRRNLIGDAELILTEIENKGSHYEMHFGYFYNGVPVYYSGYENDDRASSPLVIKANEDRVLECTWVIRSIREIQKSKKYNLYFYNLIEKQIPVLYPEIIRRDVLYFERIEPAYVFGLNDPGEQPVTPKWIISTENKDYYIPLKAEED